MDIKTVVKQAIDAKLDPYVELAKVMFNTTEVSAEQRRQAKSRAFFYIYSFKGTNK